MVFSVTLASRTRDLGSDLQDFATGALLHDIGKSSLDPSILRSTTELTDDQWQMMKKHPEFGCDILDEHGQLGEMAFTVVRHHHEKLNGHGYPDGLTNEDIPFYVRIVTIADIFDALTTKRTYKDAVGSFPALKLMHDEMSDHLDPAIFKVFVGLMGSAVETD